MPPTYQNFLRNKIEASPENWKPSQPFRPAEMKVAFCILLIIMKNLKKEKHYFRLKGQHSVLQPLKWEDLLLHITVNWIALDFIPLVRQNKKFEVVTSGSGKCLVGIFHHFFDKTINRVIIELIYQAKMPHILWFQILKYRVYLYLAVLYHCEFFGVWTVGQARRAIWRRQLGLLEITNWHFLSIFWHFREKKINQKNNQLISW